MSGLVTLGQSAPLDQAVLHEKQERLFEILRSMGRVLVAYSGGTDSAYLAWAAAEALGENAIAITADSPSIPESHKRDAVELAKQFGFRHEMIPTTEFDNEAYAANNADRCFHCKDELFTRMEQLAAAYPGHVIVYGVNKDDLGDYRPGQNAAKIHEAKAPLVEAALTKAEIRELSRLAGLPTWDRPAAACLSSRIPYGTRVTAERIKLVELAEEYVKELGFRQFRVRYQDETARIEISRDEMPAALTMDMMTALSAAVKRAGFKYASLDLDGYRQGAMNEVLDLERK
jgi:uncharacterized protein